MPLKTGALIVAAGTSSRMGGFRPMLKIGSITLAQRIVITLRQAGMDPILVVTGNNADILEKHLSNMGVVFLRNEHYMETQMLDSVKIGLGYIKDQCDRVLFTPVDVPLFTQKTVNLLLNCGNSLAIPVFEGKEGHPLLIPAAVIPFILDFKGGGGLAGAIKNCGQKRELISVKDNGTVFDLDTPEDYQELLHSHNEQLFRLQVEFRLAKESLFFGSGAALMLKMIKQTESVKTACHMMRMSYSKGWNMVQKMEEQLGFPVIERYQGGRDGGHAHLTAKGEELLDKYDRFAGEALESVREIFERIFD